ncbi:MAG: phosphatidylglycerophosphatase A [Thermodesulfobacteriota bacterium]
MSTGALAGYIPFAPGTAGTLWGVLLFYGLEGTGPMLWAAFLIVIILFAIAVSNEAEKHLQKKDPKEIVIDEIAGYAMATAFLPFTLLNVILAFILFRFFDILKPFPIRWIERRFPGGWGIVLDDCAAGIFANIALQVILMYVL